MYVEKNNVMINFISKKRIAFAFSGVLLLISLVALSFWGLKFGIDFTGGTLMEVQFTKPAPSSEQLCAMLHQECHENFIVQKSDNGRVLIRYKQSDEAFNKQVLDALTLYDKDLKLLRTDFIGGVISQRLKDNALSTILLAVSAILLYIAWAFRKISFPVSSWSYGLGAIVALAHDILIVLGVFAILGHFYGVDIGVPFVAALLTILGYSVNDTIVVYDRIRENILRTRDTAHFERLVNQSLNETLGRSLNTSLTVVVVLLAMIFWGSTSLLWFSVALLIGVIAGTYSSIFIATGLVAVIYEYKLEHHLLGRWKRLMMRKKKQR